MLISHKAGVAKYNMDTSKWSNLVNQPTNEEQKSIIGLTRMVTSKHLKKLIYISNYGFGFYDNQKVENLALPASIEQHHESFILLTISDKIWALSVRNNKIYAIQDKTFKEITEPNLVNAISKRKVT